MNQPLNQKIALVTGGSRNIGRETAIALARDGADVVITYVGRADAAASTVAELERLGVRAAAIQVNLTGTAEIDAFTDAFTDVIGDWGHSHFDILVNNAGALRRGLFHEVREDDLDFLYETNYKSLFFLTQALSPRMADGGRIINLGSGTARTAFGPLVAYGPLKAAVQSLTTYLAGALGPRGITVNAVAPGGLDNEFNGELFTEMPQARDYLRNSTALGRIGQSDDVGGVIAFLSRPESSFISGTVIEVDGGYHL